MFDDFRQDPDRQRSRKRLGGSMAAAIVVYGTVGAVAVAATATARKVVEEELQQVEFAPPPEPEPEPPPPEPEPVVKPQKTARPKVKRETLKPPDEVPLEKPKESDGPLAEAGETGPVDGFLDGVEGGTGTAKPAPPPPPKPEPLVKPVATSSVKRPDYPKAALRRGIEGTVVVVFDVLENGSPANAKAVSGPKELYEVCEEAVMRMRFKPARRGSTPVRHRMSQRFTFRLSDG